MLFNCNYTKTFFQFNRKRSVFHCFLNAQAEHDMNTMKYATFRFDADTVPIRLRLKTGLNLVSSVYSALPIIDMITVFKGVSLCDKI